MTLIIDEYKGLSINEIYQAAEMYLSTKTSTSNEQLKVYKTPRDINLSITIDKGEKIVEEFEGIQLRWEYACTETQKSVIDCEIFSEIPGKSEQKSILLSFNKKFKDEVISKYLPFVVERSKSIRAENRVVKLYSLGCFSGQYEESPWGSISLHHPSTFDTLTMDATLKKELIDDLDRFVRRKEYYKRVGKAWKRGYLLYGPPGTGKSSLIAAMANNLKFSIYDVELTSLQSNSELRRLLVPTSNQSILVIEDIDCNIDLQDQRLGSKHGDGQLKLSGLLNFIDGLWSSCGDERIIVFTTNYKDKLDPALLRPGRMDMRIDMSYCTPCGFKILASNYLGIKTHSMFAKVEELIMEVEITPAEVAEELMKSEDPDIALEGFIDFLQKKEMKCNEIDIKGEQEVNEHEIKNLQIEESDESEESGKMKKKVKKYKKRSSRKGRQ